MAVLDKRKTAFTSTAGGIGILGGLAAIFLIFMIIGCIYARVKYPGWKRRERREWVSQRRAIVQQQQAEAAQVRMRIDDEMRLNELRRASQRSAHLDVESGLAKPSPSFAAGSGRTDSLPPYDNPSYSHLPPPSLKAAGRSGSGSSVPSYAANPHI